MKTITFKNHLGSQTCLTDENENILSSLLRSYTKGLKYGCQLGICFQCLMNLKEGEIEWIIPPDKKAEMELMQDEILACQCRALSDITIAQR